MSNCTRSSRRACLTATTVCFISALLIGTSSLTGTSASANEMRQQGKQHHGGGGRGSGAVGLGIGIGGIVLDQMQRQRMQQSKGVSSRPAASKKKGGMSSGSSAKKKNKKKDNPSVVKKKGGPTIAKEEVRLPGAKSPSQGSKAPPVLWNPDAPRGSVAAYEEILKYEQTRLAAEEEYKRRHERELASIRDPAMQTAWRQVIADSAIKINELRSLIASIESVLEERRSQAKLNMVPPAPPASPPTHPEPTPVATPGPTDTPPATPVATNPPPAAVPGTGSNPETPASSSQPGDQPTYSSAGPCPDHVAELTNRKRVFHRLYVMGKPDNENERKAWWNRALAPLMARLAVGSAGGTTSLLDQPTEDDFAAAVERLQKVAHACEEVTIYLNGHGIGGFDHGKGPRGNVANDEIKREAFLLNQRRDPANPNLVLTDVLWDHDLGAMIKGFRPDVSITVIVSVCYGGGFAGPGNVEESQLVKVIGLYTQCWGGGNFEAAIGAGIESAAANNPDGRATANDVKGHMTRNNWPLGEPFDTATDTLIQDNWQDVGPR
jgi:hypothetical protein